MIFYAGEGIYNKTPIWILQMKIYSYLHFGYKTNRPTIWCFAGLKGKIVNNVSYNIRGSYINERNRALFRSNDYSENRSNEDYAYGNSFQVVYDDMKTVSFQETWKLIFQTMWLWNQRNF
jgi:hypothetical protein